MKKTNFFYRSAMLFGALGMLFTSCESTDPAPGIEVDKDAPAIEILATGEAVDYTFTANEAWTATADQTWVTLTPASGKGGGKATISISAEVNEKFENRTANVTFKAGETTLSVKITQFTALPTITFFPEAVAIPSTLETTVSVTSNVTYVVVAKPEWVEVEFPETMIGTQDVVIKANSTSDADRSGEITLAETGKTEVLATIPVSVKATPDATTTMLNTNFGANQFYVMHTHRDIKIEGMEDGTFRLVGIELNGTTLGTAEASWLTFEKNPAYEQTLVYTAKAANYADKKAIRSARIFIAPSALSNEAIIAAGEKFKVADVKQFPDAVQFGRVPNPNNLDNPTWYRSIDLTCGNPNPMALFKVESNGFEFVGTYGRPLAISNKNTVDQTETVPGPGIGVGVSQGQLYPKMMGTFKLMGIGEAEFTQYWAAKVIVDGVEVEGLFKVTQRTQEDIMAPAIDVWSNDVPESK